MLTSHVMHPIRTIEPDRVRDTIAGVPLEDLPLFHHDGLLYYAFDSTSHLICRLVKFAAHFGITATS